MPAIGHRLKWNRILQLIALAVMYLGGLPLEADRTASVLETLNHVATALASDSATDAMTPFDKSFPKYVTLRDYFLGLTNGSQLVNEIDVLDEQDSGTQSNLTVQWTLTLTNKATLQTERRTSEITLRFKLEAEKWKIVDFSPIDLFNPQPKQQPR